MKEKVVITAKCHSFLIQQLEQKGFEVLYEPKIGYQELYNIIQNCTGLITTTSITFDTRMIDKAVQLRFIGRLGSGLEHIDVEYAKSKNIQCVSSPEGNCNAVGEHCLGMLLNLMNNISKSNNEIKIGKYLRDENRGDELFGKTVGIIGFGNTGQSFAKLLSSFNVTVMFNDIKEIKHSFSFSKQVELKTIFDQADVISFHVPLTHITRGMVNEAFLNSFTKQPYLINTSRGEIINTEDLIESIKKNKLKAVALDVLENEKLNTYTPFQKEQLNFLLNQSNVIITPHIAGYSQQALFKMAKVVLEKLDLIN